MCRRRHLKIWIRLLKLWKIENVARSIFCFILGGKGNRELCVCVFGGILWVFFNRQFDIYSRSSFEGAYKKAGVCTHHTHKSSSPRREFSRSLALGIGQIPPFSFPAREEPTHTRHWGKGSPALWSAHRDHPHFLWGGLRKRSPRLLYWPMTPSPSLAWLAGWWVCTPHPPNLPPVETPKGKKSPQDQVSGESRSVAPAQQYYSLRSSRHIPLGHLLRVLFLVSIFLSLIISQLVISSPVTHLVTFEKIILEKFRVCDKRSIF
jgi:hypothetical protein